MSRPLSTWRAEQLEELFRSKRSEKATLEKLEHELGFRQTTRAMALLDIVKSALRALPKPEVPQSNAFELEPSPAISAPDDRAKQGRLWGAPAAIKAAAPPAPALTPTLSVNSASSEASPALDRANDEPPAVPPEVPVVAAVSATVKKPTTKQPVPDDDHAAFALTTDEAYKELKVQPSASWEHIEQSRRQIVQKGSPALTRSLTAEQRERLDEAARRANAAFRLLANMRTYH
jgi:hypothetical protein